MRELLKLLTTKATPYIHQEPCNKQVTQEWLTCYHYSYETHVIISVYGNNNKTSASEELSDGPFKWVPVVGMVNGTTAMDLK